MTKIKGRWITQEETEVRILRRLLNEGPLNIPTLENKHGNDKLSHASVIKTIQKLLDEKKIKISTTDTSIPRKPIKTFEIQILGIMRYLDWVFPNVDIKFREDLWKGIEESGKKFSYKNIKRYFPLIGRHLKILDELIGGGIFHWFGVAYGQTSLSLVLPPLQNKTPTDLVVPDSYDFSFKIQLKGLSRKFELFHYEIKISELFLVHTKESIIELEKYNMNSLNFDIFCYIMMYVLTIHL